MDVDRLPVPRHGLGQGFRIKSTEDLNDLGERLAVLGQNLTLLGQNLTVLGQNLTVLGQNLTVLGQNLTLLGQNLTVLGQNLTVLLLYLLNRVNSVFDVEHGVTQGADGVVLLGELAGKARDSGTSHEGQSIEAGTSPRYRCGSRGQVAAAAPLTSPNGSAGCSGRLPSQQNRPTNQTTMKGQERCPYRPDRRH